MVIDDFSTILSNNLEFIRLGGPRKMSTQTPNLSQIIQLYPPPPPQFLLRPNPPPLPKHPLAPILRPLYLEIVNRQLTMEIKRSEWENDLQNLFFGDQQEAAIEKKRVHWADAVQVFELEEHEEEEDLYQAEPDKERKGQIRNDDDRSDSCRKRVSPSGLDPASVERFSPPFPHRFVKDNASINRESDFEVPFPSRSTVKFEPENSEEAFSPPFPI